MPCSRDGTRRLLLTVNNHWRWIAGFLITAPVMRGESIRGHSGVDIVLCCAVPYRKARTREYAWETCFLHAQVPRNIIKFRILYGRQPGHTGQPSLPPFTNLSSIPGSRWAYFESSSHGPGPTPVPTSFLLVFTHCLLRSRSNTNSLGN
jgi:hypothetical protein